MTPLTHRQFPPLDPATIGKAMRDGRAYGRGYAHNHYRIGAMPSARATWASPRAALRRLVHAASVAIAAFLTLYMAWEFLR